MPKRNRLFFRSVLTVLACGLVWLFVAARPLVRNWAYHEMRTQQPTCLGYDMAEWLQMLRLNSTSRTNPLQIVNIVYDKSAIATAEVLLSYDLLNKHGFLNIQNAKFNMNINGTILTSTCWRGAAGDCLLPFDKNELVPGLNLLQVEFTIFGRTNLDYIRATGPARRVIWTNELHQPNE
jgi:hypothetical protein